MNWLMIEEIARRVRNLSNDYVLCSASQSDDCYNVALIRYHVYAKGTNKGKPNRNKRNGEAEEVLLSPENVRFHTANWVAETGKCPRCFGRGKRTIHCSTSETRYIHCEDCDGTGNYNKSGERVGIGTVYKVARP